MCDLVTLATAAGLTQSALQINSVNRSIESQSESTNTQLKQNYAETAYDTRQQAKSALDEGYKAAITKRQAVGSANVRASALGIRGQTAADLVNDEIQVGSYNIAGAKEARRNADTAYTMSTHNSYGAAKAQQKSLKAQAPSMFESIVAIGAGGLTGYLSGTAASSALSGVPEDTNLIRR